MSKNEPKGGKAYCPHCGRQCETISTVPWQDDICSECNNSIPSDS
jgi:hypothetical protein